MAATSPASAYPSVLGGSSSPSGGSMMEWDEGAVQSWLAGMGLGQYEDAIHEQGITGDVLAVLDHSALVDLGITSIGHRLNLLRAVWELKKEQGVELGEDDWQPQGMNRLITDLPDVQVQKEEENVRRLWDMIVEQNERLVNLERDHARMMSTLAEHGLEVPVASSGDGDLDRIQARKNGLGGNGPAASNGDNAGAKVGRSGSLRWRDQGTKSDDEAEGGNTRRPPRRASMLFPPTLGSSTSSNPETSRDPYPPNHPHPSLESPTEFRSSSTLPQAKASSLQKPPLTRLMSDGPIMTSSPPATTPPMMNSSINSLGNGSGAGPSSLSTSTGSQGPSNPATQAQGSSSSNPSGPSEHDKSRAKDAAHSAAKSFRVTLEDPCWKVLPAALKKYKIDDDWKMYALFICFGNTERCLSYDEKPLLLFQKLKESGQRPVFMLRHIRDIKSPITVAQQKQATKLGLPPGSVTNVLPKIKPASESASSPTKPGTLQPTTTGREDGRAFPELPSPRLQEGESFSTNQSGDRSAGVRGTLVDKDGNVTNVTYAVAIYPYIADRQDEFDVAVGATFVILSKAKGWYIVQKDPEGQGNIVPDQGKSGWVPAGCLLELSSPIGLASPASETNAIYPGLSPLPPTAIMSSSYPGLVLMDYEAKGDSELNLKEGDKVKVYKKYCHWSYTIMQDTGERGWVPAWFIGKIGGSTSNPTSASAAGSSTTSLPGTASGSNISAGGAASNTALTEGLPNTAGTLREQAAGPVTAGTMGSGAATKPSTGTGTGAGGEELDSHRDGMDHEGYM